MKKLLIAIFILAMMGTQALAYNYDAQFKKGFYEGLIISFFQSLQQSLLSQGFDENSVYMYVSTTRARIDRKDLENATWACVSKYSPTQLQNNSTKIIDECFDGWFNKFFFEKNADALKLLRK